MVKSSTRHARAAHLVPIPHIDDGEAQVVSKYVVVNLLLKVSHAHDTTARCWCAPVAGDEATDTSLDGGVDEGQLVFDAHGEDGTDNCVDPAKMAKDFSIRVRQITGYNLQSHVPQPLDCWLVCRGASDEASDVLRVGLVLAFVKQNLTE